MDREICARGAVGSLRRFEGEEEEWRGGEEEKKIARWLRGEDAKKRWGRREKERKEPMCSPPVHILGSPGPRPTDEANPRDWWRVVGRRATSEASLPCRLGPLLDDHPETRLMGPVGAPEIPTRTGHNARLKVGSTTDGKAPTDATTFKQGRTVTSPDLRPALPFPLPFVALPSRPFFLSRPTSPSSIRPHTPHPLLILSNPGDSLVHPPSSACSRPHSLLELSPPMTESCAGPQAPCASGLHCMRRHSAGLKKIDALKDQNDDDKQRF